MSNRLCQLKTTLLPDGKYHHRCVQCGKEEVLLTANWYTPCGKRVPSMRQEVAMPGVARRAANFVSEVAKWEAAGRPRRTPQRIEEIYATLCQPCNLFKVRGSEGTCRACGCNLSPENKLLNKLMMATTRCPVGKWQAEADETTRSEP